MEGHLGRRRATLCSVARVPGTTLALGSIISIQIGAAVAEPLFPVIGPPAVVLMRQGFAAIILLAIARPRLAGRTRRDMALLGAFGLTLGLLNLCFYEAIKRLPLGPAVTIELLGPLGLAAVQSRTTRHIVAVILAIVGIIMLGGSASGLDPVGLVFVLIAAAGWGIYIVLSRQVGRRFESVDGLALAMAIAAVVVLPSVAATSHNATWTASIVGRGLVVALLAAAIPFSLELSALRTVSTRRFGIIMGTSPAIATLIGWVSLGEHLGVVDVIAIGFVTVAAILSGGEQTPPSATDVLEPATVPSQLLLE
jgi:inner membrane transporter RhtA